MIKTTFTEEAFTTLKALSEKDFQNLLYNMCKTKYPELSDLWFIIDEQNNQTQVEVKYKNSISDE